MAEFMLGNFFVTITPRIHRCKLVYKNVLELDVCYDIAYTKFMFLRKNVKEIELSNTSLNKYNNSHCESALFVLSMALPH